MYRIFYMWPKPLYTKVYEIKWFLLSAYERQCCENYSKKVISKNYNYFSEKVIITITNYFFPKVINYQLLITCQKVINYQLLFI